MLISSGVTDLTEPVQALLTSLPDPASAIRFLGRLRQESPGGFARICGPGQADGVDGAALRCALHIFSYSNFLSEACIRNPEALWEAARPGSLDRLCSRDDYRLQLERSLGSTTASHGGPSALDLAGFATEVMDLLQADPTPHEILVEGVLMHRWAERDGTYDELVAQRSQALAMLPSRQVSNSRKELVMRVTAGTGD